MEADLATWIYNQGVAVAMLIYFIVRFEKILKSNTNALNDIKDLIKQNGKRG